MSKNKYKIDCVYRDECEYKRPKGGMQVGTFPKGVRIEDIESEIMVISLKGRSQLENKEKAMSIFNLKEENNKLKEFLYFNFCENKYEPDKLIIEAGRALEIFDLLEWRKNYK